jgi:hypothetical protein
VDDGSTDGTAEKLEAIRRPNVRIKRYMKASGEGACLTKALAVVEQPLLLLAGSDYPYTPGDLKLMLQRIDMESEVPNPATGEFEMRKPDVVCGCRTGVPVPGGFRIAGWLYRWFCKIALGLPLQPLPGWYGFREHAAAWWGWIVYGVPLEDPNAKFKLFRTSFLKRFPIQSSRDFVHIELIAKATFLTCVLDEVPLTPQNVPVPRATWWKWDRTQVFRDPQFVKPNEVVPVPAESV